MCYVHRIGRTAWAGKTEIGISLWERRDWKHAGELLQIIEDVPDCLREEACKYRTWNLLMYKRC